MISHSKSGSARTGRRKFIGAAGMGAVATVVGVTKVGAAPAPPPRRHRKRGIRFTTVPPTVTTTTAKDVKFKVAGANPKSLRVTVDATRNAAGLRDFILQGGSSFPFTTALPIGPPTTISIRRRAGTTGGKIKVMFDHVGHEVVALTQTIN